jgi:hypothetical protein
VISVARIGDGTGTLERGVRRWFNTPRTQRALLILLLILPLVRVAVFDEVGSWGQANLTPV